MKLKDFKPYNDLNYFDCHSKAMFHIFEFFNISAYSFLLNQLYAFEYRWKDKLSFFLQAKKFDFDILENVGVKKEIIFINDSPIGCIRRALDNGSPIVLRIDCFYLPFRIDTYKREHVFHFICIYGYSRINRCFYIIDHDYVNSFQYKKHKLSFKDLKNYISYYSNEKLFCTAYSKANADSVPERLNISTYLRFLLNNADLLIEGIKNLYDFTQFFIKELKKEDNKQFLQDISLVIVNITRCVKQRQDLLKVYILDSVLQQYMNKIDVKWTFIRAILLKTLRYDEESQRNMILELCKCSLEVYEMEKDFNRKLIEYCKKELNV